MEKVINGRKKMREDEILCLVLHGKISVKSKVLIHFEIGKSFSFRILCHFISHDCTTTLEPDRKQ